MGWLVSPLHNVPVSCSRWQAEQKPWKGFPPPPHRGRLPTTSHLTASFGPYLRRCLGFPGGASGKEHVCQCRRCKRSRFHPWVGKILWRRARGNLIPYSCLENPMDRGAWWAMAQRVTESPTQLKWPSMHTKKILIKWQQNEKQNIIDIEVVSHRSEKTAEYERIRK